MAFSGMILTNKGREALAKAQLGKQLSFAGIVIGDGTYGGSYTDIRELSHQVAVLDVLRADVKENICTLEADLSNAGLQEGYYLKELGILAKDGEETVLYAYTNAGADAEYIPAGNGSVDVEKRLRIALMVDGVAEVTFASSSVLYVSQQELEEKLILLQEQIDAPDISDKTVDFTENAGYEIASGEKVSVLFGKIRKLISTIKSKAPNLLTAGRVPVADRLNHQFGIDGLNFNGSNSVRRFIACNTAADVAAKSVAIPNFTVEHGSVVNIRFFKGNTAVNPTMNVNGSGNFPILYLGQPVEPEMIPPDAILELICLNNATWRVIGVVPEQAQADWNQTDVNAPDFVKNKPNIKTGSGKFSVDAGYRCDASGIASFTEGNETRATQSAAHAEGSGTQANGQGAHSEGLSCIAGNNAAHAEGIGNQANGTGSHAEGYLTRTQGTASHSEGYGTVAQSSTQHVEGRFNVSDGGERYLHIAGNGTADNARSNAHTLDWRGNAEFAGDVIAKGCGGDEPVSMVGMKKMLDLLDSLLWKESNTSRSAYEGELWVMHSEDVIERENSTLPHAMCLEIHVSPGEVYKIITYGSGDTGNNLAVTVVADVGESYSVVIPPERMKDEKNIMIIEVPRDKASDRILINKWGFENDVEVYESKI